MNWMVVSFVSVVGILAFAAGAEPRVFHVDDFGAKPDSGEDAGPAIRAAIASALAVEGSTEVRFGPGEYIVGANENARFHLEISDASNLILNGNDATIILQNPLAGGVAFHSSSTCGVKGLTFDYETLPFTQGTVVDVDEEGGTFDLDIDPGFPDLDTPWMQRTLGEAIGSSQLPGFGMQRERDSFRLKENAVSAMALGGWEHIADRVYRVRPTNETGLPLPWPHMEVGDGFVYVARTHGAVVYFYQCDTVDVHDITIYAGPSAAVIADQTDDLHVRNLRVMVKPDSGRMNSTNGDGVHAPAARRGPLIEDSLFEGMADDGTNSYASPYILREVVSPTEVIVQGWRPIETGDRFEVFDPVEGILRGQVRAVEVHQKEAHATWRLVLDTAVEGMVAGEDHRSADHFYNSDASSQGLTIRNCVFRNFRGRGNVVRTENVLIENNTYDHLSGQAIQVANEPDWPEGPMSENVIIRGNTFNNIGTQGHMGGHPLGGVVGIMGSKLGYGLAQSHGQRHIRIEDNTFHNWPRIGIYLGSVHDATVQNNRFTADEDRATYDGQAVAVVLENVSGVTLANNAIADSRELQAVVQIRETGETSDLNLEDAFETELTDGVPLVLDERP